MSRQGSLQDRVVLITGASTGIGRATALAFARAGCSTILVSRNAAALEALSREIAQLSPATRTLPLSTDLKSHKQIKASAERALERFGVVDVLVNNAGVANLGWVESLDPEKAVGDTVRVNLTGLIWMTQAILPSMQARRQGHVVNVSSLAGMIATPTYCVYAATKFGVRGFTEALRREVAPWGIRVTGVYPGAVRTGLAREAVRARKTRLTTPGWLRLDPEDVARAIVSLVRRPRATSIIPGAWLPIVWLNALWPRSIDWISARWFVAREREGELR